MDDFESRLEHELSGLGRTPLSEPETIEQLRSRARRGRTTRALGGLVAVAAVVAVVVGAITFASNREPTDQHVQVAAPNFVLGDIDTVVLSSNFDEDGARNPLPANIARVVARVPGVERVSGVVATFTPLTNDPIVGPRTEPPRTPILFSYHQADEIQLTGGRLPAAANEIVVDADFLSRNKVAIGDGAPLLVRGATTEMVIVGTFTIPDVDLDGIPLAAMAARFQSPELALDRIDVKLAPDAEPATVRDAIARAVGSAYTVMPPSIISFPDQRLAQLEIQHAYWSLISTDPEERANAADNPNPDANDAYEQYRGQAVNAELRVENVTFLSPTTASLTYRVFYSGAPSPIINAPQPGAATRVDGMWKLSSATLCQLAAFENIPCETTGKVTLTPPAGWRNAAYLDGSVRAALTVLADPAATVDQRLDVLAGGDSVRALVEQGLENDAASGDASLSILGWRPAEGGVEVLYVLVTSKGPSTPWPMIARLVPGANGDFVAGSQYACGIDGLTRGACIVGDPGTPLTLPAAPARP
jgi:hypothetical protein